MPWVELHEKLDWRVPGKRAFKVFPVGKHLMTRAQAAKAEQLGKGKVVVKEDGRDGD